jgi:hypothetical protein
MVILQPYDIRNQHDYIRITTKTMGKFAPKEPVDLYPPKDDLFTKEELSRCDGMWVPLYLSGPYQL